VPVSIAAHYGVTIFSHSETIMKSINSIYLALGLSLGSFAPFALAEDRFPSVRTEEFEWGLGLGALAEDEGYRGMSMETNAQPIVYASSYRFRFLSNQVDYQFIRNERWLVGIKAEGRFDGFEADDADTFTGMEEREGGIYGGFRVEYRSGFGNFVGEYVTEVAGDANGSYGSLGSYWVLETGIGDFVPKVAVEYYNSDYADYYYGVRSTEALPWRPAYAGETMVNLDVGFDYVLTLGERHRILSSLKYRRYDSAVQDSPLIDAKGSPRFVLGYFYTF
jgi:outer membrane protein